MFTHNKIILNNKGIGLIEIAISITMLGIGILGLLHAFPKGISIQHSIELQTIANHLAQEKIENIISLAYEDITEGIIENQINLDENDSSEFYKFKRTTLVELVDENLNSSIQDIGIKKITVTIQWPKSFTSENDSVSIVTLVSKK